MTPDPAEQALESLQAERWQKPGHQEELLAKLEHGPAAARPPRRFLLLAAGAVLGGIVTAATVTAADGWRWLARLFYVTVVDVEREGGEIQKLILEDGEGRRLHLEPVDEPPVQVIEVEREDGGTMRLRVVREGGLGIVPTYSSIGLHGEPRPGQRLQLQRSNPGRFRAALRDGCLHVTSLPDGGSERTFVLQPVAGHPQRYSDGLAVIEVVE